MNALNNAAIKPRATASGNTAIRQDYLVFRLADREFGIALEEVQELCNYDLVTPLAGAPGFIAGTMTRGGRQIAIVDLHVLLAAGLADKSRLTDVVILQADGRISGLAVDCVIDVVAAGAEDITAADAGGTCVIGLATLGKRSILLLDAERLMTNFQPVPDEKLAA
ncbi:MAG TPA: chemotaxis protein CheW [Noviherbaspirillum sp.]|nr:chemotaxis protein CheW [Noviherbaspirillum sp.]